MKFELMRSLRLVEYLQLALMGVCFIAWAGAGGLATAQTPTQWQNRGVGGGGALFSPSINPFDPNEIFVGSDLSGLFRTTDFGKNWKLLNSAQILSQVQYSDGKCGGTCKYFNHLQFARNPQTGVIIRFALTGGKPTQSTDNGLTWVPFGKDPTDGKATYLFVDRKDGKRILVADFSSLFFSTDGGQSYNQVFHTDAQSGLYIAGVFFGGGNIYVCTNTDMLVATNGTTNFTSKPFQGINPGEAPFSFTGAMKKGLTRFFCVTFPAISVHSGVSFSDDELSGKSVYRLELKKAGDPIQWQSVTPGISTRVTPMFVASSDTLPNVAYLAGNLAPLPGEVTSPVVLKTTNGGQTWETVFKTLNNENIETGWSGSRGDVDWDFGGIAFGVATAPNDPNYVIVTDKGFLHASSDGGQTWRQVYTRTPKSNPSGTPTPKGQALTSIGMEPTSSWWLAWADADTLFTGFTDIKGIRSTDRGNSWSFNYAGHNLNSMYQVVSRNGVLYGATSNFHDLYQFSGMNLDTIDKMGTDGGVWVSNNKGGTWVPIFRPYRPVVCLALDPNHPNRMFAAVVHSQEGGIYLLENIQPGQQTTAKKLAAPVDVAGNPFNITVLKDGTLVCTYSGIVKNNKFNPNSGVFVSTDEGRTWDSRTETEKTTMKLWSKDLVVDPFDPAQNTWYVGVWKGYGDYAMGRTGGLYRTTDRGQNWSRLGDFQNVTSCTINPNQTDQMYVTTQDAGLWVTNNRKATQPSFTRVKEFPFRQPERVFFNPFNPKEIWVTSFGAGLWVGTLP